MLIRLTFALMAALAGCREEADPWRELLADHVTTTGHISRLDCGEHAGMSYVFTAGARSYGADAPADGFDCRTARVGDPVLVYYAPSAPEISTLLTPGQAYDRAHGRTPPAAGWLALVGAAAVALSLLAKFRGSRHAA